MNYETVKSFILVVLIAISFLLSFILWSYQPNYDYLYDVNYVNEVDIGGEEKVKQELIKPSKIVFRQGDTVKGFGDTVDEQQFFQTLMSWELYDYKVKKVDGRPKDNTYVEIVFPNALLVELMENTLSFHDANPLPDWTFSRAFLILNEETKTMKLKLLSENHEEMIEASIEKPDAYQLVFTYLENERNQEDFLVIDKGRDPVYVKSGPVKLKSKTFVASKIKPDLFINALFTNPNLVTQNVKEAYFTDGQRGMRIVQDGRLLQFINPLQEKFEDSSALDLLDKSVMNINEHKGWTNNYYLESIRPNISNIKYRLHYAGYPVYNYGNLTIIEQEWREQDLHQYNRPLIRIGNLLNARDIETISGDELVSYLEADKKLNLEKLTDVQLGYMLTILDDNHSLQLEPQWSLHYDGKWVRFNVAEYERQRGGDF